MSFHTKLINLLKTDPRLVDDEGELIIAAVQDRAWQVDRALVKLLLSDAEIKAKFFQEIEGHWIFNFNTFIDYVSQKNFLDNSYTRFKNHIGLTIGEKYLRERGDVALVWPYKDCVLEGGQTQEEEKRKEIFFNAVLAQDEINRLLDPKVLTNFARYTAKGKEKVTAFKRDENGVIRENLIIKSNNLLAPHTLKQQFRGQVKLIYIDPPYNTGNDSFGYNDNFNHSTWLTFMKNRLEVAKILLRDDGVIFVNCDDNEQAYLKILMDEEFGHDSFVACFIWNHRKSSQNDIDVSLSHNYILCYARDRQQFKLNPLGIDSEKFSNPDNDPKGDWVADPMDAPNIRPNLTYEIKNPNTGEKFMPPEGRCWRFTKEKYKEAFTEGRIVFGKSGKSRPQYKRYKFEACTGPQKLDTKMGFRTS
jgi:adenine-specific DNA-methyltransferase